MAVGQRPYAEWAPTLGGVYLYLKYNAGFVNLLKDTVPAHERSWDGAQKVWYVGQNYATNAILTAKEFWPNLDTSNYDRRSKGQYDHARTSTSSSTSAGHQWQRNGPYGRTHFNAPCTAPAPPNDYATLYLVTGAPPEVVREVYKALARLYHPDKGGDPARMQTINAAMDRLKKVGKA